MVLETLLPAFNIYQVHDKLGNWFWRSGNGSCLQRHTPVVVRIVREI